MGFLSALVTAATEKAEKAKKTLVPKSGWSSRKLWIFAGVAFALIWLGRGNLITILDGLIFLTAVYLITQSAHDIVSDIAGAWVKRQEIRSEADVSIATAKLPTTSSSNTTTVQ